MKSALIGYTGFVGSNLATTYHFGDIYNSKNICDIHEKEYDLVVSAGTPGAMWIANQNPQADLENIQNLIKDLSEVKTKKFVLISTIEVYPRTIDITENTVLEPKLLKPYGLNRYYLEQFVKENFFNYTILRLPTLFGQNLKKNFVCDLIHNCYEFTHKDSKLQWYNLSHLWEDISIAIKNNIPIINISVEPTTAAEVAKYALGIDFTTITQAPPRTYDMRTKYSHLYGKNGPYLYDKQTSLNELKEFITKEKSNE